MDADEGAGKKGKKEKKKKEKKEKKEKAKKEKVPKVKKEKASKRNRPYAASSEEAGYSDFYYGTFRSYFDFAGKFQFTVWTGYAAGKG